MTTPKQHLLLGAHMSVAGGLEQAIIRGTSIGCTAIQLFTKNNRQWKSKELTQKDLNLFHQTREKSDIKVIVAHASYLINVGSPDKVVSAKSTNALRDEIKRCELLRIPYLVVHPGSHLSTSQHACLTQIAAHLDNVLENSSGTTMVLLETMAGQGSSVCHTFEHIALIRSLSRYPEKIGVCFDTCHAFAAGYDFRTERAYQQLWSEFDTTIGLKHLKVIHVNDSKKEFGSRVDRHEHIGKGTIGLDAFKLLINDPHLVAIPKILETPKENLQDDLHNMKIIKNLLR